MTCPRCDTIPRKDTSIEKLSWLPPVFDRASGHGTLTAGNSSLLGDGAASVRVASTAGLAKLPIHEAFAAQVLFHGGQGTVALLEAA